MAEYKARKWRLSSLQEAGVCQENLKAFKRTGGSRGRVAPRLAAPASLARQGAPRRGGGALADVSAVSTAVEVATTSLRALPPR